MMWMRNQDPQTGWRLDLGGWFVKLCFLFTLSARAATGDVEEGQRLYLKGDYAACQRMAERAVEETSWKEEWPLLCMKAQLAVGKYPEALATANTALKRFRSSVQIRLLAWEVFNANGRTEQAEAILDELGQIINSQTRIYRNPLNLVALGQAALLLKAEPKLVLENFFEQAKRMDAKCREAYLASGELALSKHDFGLAAKVFTDALEKFPDDPEAAYGLARSYAPSERPQMVKWVQEVLDFNAQHVPSVLLLVDHAIDAEEYAEADKLIERALKVNSWHPEAWAYRALLAELRNQSQAQKEALKVAYKYWPTNPKVSYLIGKKLSQKYRFAEGSRQQRQALQFDPNYLPAKIQLAQDLLRLGQDTEGWKLAEEVHQEDGYDVTAYNLVTLRETLSKFQTLTNQDFVVRMSAKEAAIYGDRVIALLLRAKQHLTQKYGLDLKEVVTVEIFPEQKEFAVRTFGMPENPGFLGVCFGPVITANSPAAQVGHPANWEAVLWHEFCHVVTLHLTRNKMPRWLSEGISVYEERQTNPTWGQAMNPKYRELILSGGLTPVGKLSAAFMTAKDNLAMQFAYYQSSLVVEYLSSTYGLEAMKNILSDLGQGKVINEAIEQHTAPLTKIEPEFAAYARRLAEQLGPGLDWRKPKEKVEGLNLMKRGQKLLERAQREAHVPEVEISSEEYEHPEKSTNYWVLLEQSKKALGDKQYARAKPLLQKLIALYPNQTGAESAYALLAAAHRGLKETEQERAVLDRLAALEADAHPVYLRLMELHSQAPDWAGVATNAERFLAVNPLIPQPYRYLAQASEALGKPDQATRAYERLLLLDPSDPADVHYRLARLLHQQGETHRAKRHVLQALEEAPRFREAQRLLLQIVHQSPEPRVKAKETIPES